jgi:8-oxo-dGTP pyrophosphatase MutT (NUDIX family)
VAAVLGDSLKEEARADGIQRFVVGAVVHSNGRVLVLTRSPDDDFPGIEEVPSGGVEPAESLNDALRRELNEEVGSCPERIDAGFLATFDYDCRSGRRVRQFTVSVAPDEREVRLSGEHAASRWIEGDEIASTSATDETKQVLSDWFTWAGLPRHSASAAERS